MKYDKVITIHIEVYKDGLDEVNYLKLKLRTSQVYVLRSNDHSTFLT